ncbi:uncharacterized protein EAE98_011236 [Botrytis deweyae]|uniref:FF domain-containing protein n=1 Tax=Botrytis deweyae TaxID=2478750 RepID=A0ABQ7I6Q7_9HELO|nr:uncharacterized protein EAE98_011236 [Botrytis deweyae]KAF7915370.1 hypothetical protein EAE98_011236 [Botrytis deweyae]
MSQADGPTLKAIFNTGFAVTQAISKKLSSSELQPQNQMSIFSSTPGLPTDLATPRPKRTKLPGPATQLLNELFDEVDEIEAVESIEDSTYVDVDHARKRAGRLRLRPRPRIETSFKSKSSDGPNQSAGSSDFFMNSSVDYSHLTVSPEEDLQKLADRFGEIQSRNKQIIEADDDAIWKSLPDLNTGSFSRYAKLRGSAKAYEKEFQDALKKEKDIYESTPGFIKKQMPGLSATDMRKQIPRLINAEAEYEFDEEDEDEKHAIEILEALFKELAEREASTNKNEWKSVKQIIEGVENKGKNDGEEQAVAIKDMDRRSEMNHSARQDTHKSREINIFSDFAEETDDEIRHYSAITQQHIKDGCKVRGLDQIIEKDEEQPVQPQQPSQVEPEITPSPELEEKNKQEITEPQQNVCEVSPVMEPPKVNKKETIPQEQPDIEGNTKEDEDSQNSSQNHDNPESQNLDIDIYKHIDEATSASSSAISYSTSSIDGSASEEEDEMQLGMAALATGVMITALWMIERKTAAVC